MRKFNYTIVIEKCVKQILFVISKKKKTITAVKFMKNWFIVNCLNACSISNAIKSYG